MIHMRIELNFYCWIIWNFKTPLLPYDAASPSQQSIPMKEVRAPARREKRYAHLESAAKARDQRAQDPSRNRGDSVNSRYSSDPVKVIHTGYYPQFLGTSRAFDVSYLMLMYPKELFWSPFVSVCPSVCKLFTFCSSSERMGHFQRNLAQSILGWRGFKFEGPCPILRGDKRDIKKIHWQLFKIFFSRAPGPISPKLSTFKVYPNYAQI